MGNLANLFAGAAIAVMAVHAWSVRKLLNRGCTFRAVA